MDFETYLRNKKIDPQLFQNAESKLWNEFKTLFEQIHPDSFTAQKLFLINAIRRKYPFKEEVVEKKTNSEVQSSVEEKTLKPKIKIPSPASAKAKPRMAPKVKIPIKPKKKD